MIKRKMTIVYSAAECTPYREHVDELQLAMIVDVASELGWECNVVKYDPKDIGALLRATKPDLVINLCYGYVDQSAQILELQPDVTRRIECNGINVLGSSSGVQMLTQDKLVCGEYLSLNGFLSPTVLNPFEQYCPSKLIIKPRFGACHRNIFLGDSRSSVETLLSGEEEMMAQEYIDGDEYTVAVVELNGKIVALPTLQVNPLRSRSSWIMNSDHSFSLSASTANMSKLQSIAVDAFRRLRMRHYARFDFRVRDQNEAYILDVNSLPNLHPHSSLFPLAAREFGFDYRRMIVGLIETAERSSRPTSFGSKEPT